MPRPRHEPEQEIPQAISMDGIDPDVLGPESITNEGDRRHHAIARAVHFRRLQFTDSTGVINNWHRENIIGIGLGAHERPLRNGWIMIGHVYDPREWQREVHWHPETDRVRIMHPPTYVPPSESTYRPIRFVGTTAPQVQVDEGFVYTFEGVDYASREAARKLNEDANRDAEGWTWRRIG